ncbi:glycoside hydrolase family 19 protein [Achromobacter spanius]|uniref:Chitinase n=1 Tax=Achromobacter spanius TaxID=217203 RepID=A0A2S0IC35_9BURK|nr:hypothetical protein [Achromobacter spanius]AVJ29605.1 hypothetical protein CLM73_22255 [Achromobacter spanius]
MSDTTKPTSRMGYPFKAKDGKPFADTQPVYEGLALAQGGHFPLGSNGHFHGGIHFDRATANVFAIDDGAQCLADGEIVAYRLDSKYPDATLTAAECAVESSKDKAVLRPYSTGFVLVRHRLQAPALPAPAKQDAAAQVSTKQDYGTRLATRANGPSVGWLPVHARVALLDMQDGWIKVRVLPPSTATWTNAPVDEPWLPGYSLDTVPARLPNRWFSDGPLTATVVLPSQPRPANPSGATAAQSPPPPAAPSLTLYSLYMHLADGASYAAAPNRPKPKWWPKKQYLVRQTPNKWTLQGKQIGGLMVRSAPVSKQQNELGILVHGSVLEVEAVAGNDKWVTVKRIIKGGIATKPAGTQITSLDTTGFVFLKELDELRAPASLDSIETPSPPIPINMGDLIGHMGEQVSSNEALIAEQPTSRPTLHLEVFSGQDVPQFLRDCRKHADKLAERHWTLLRLRKDDQIKGEPKDSAPVVVTMGSDWTIAVTRETPLKNDDKGQRWVNVKVHAADGSPVVGWAKDKDRRCTPWHWPEFEVVDAASNDAGTWWEGTAAAFVDYLRGGTRPPESPFFTAVRRLAGMDDDGELDEKTLDAALRDRNASRRLGGLIAYHTSEWFVPSWASKFGVISEVAMGLGKWAMENVRAEKNCVMRLRWWSDVADAGLPDDAKIYHFHGAGLVNIFSKSGTNRVTVPMLQSIFPHAPASRLAVIAEGVNENLDAGKLDSEFRLCHFFGQVKQEIGTSASFRENLNYSSDGLFNSRLGYYRGNRERSDQDAKNEEAIANNAYADKHRPAGYKLGNTEPGDGWLYRGRGLKQLTGRTNYKNFSASHQRIWGGNVDFEKYPDKVSEPIYAVRSALVFWLDNRLYVHADSGIGDDAIDKVTKIINEGTDSYEDRRKHVKECWVNRTFRDVFSEFSNNHK